MIEGKYYRVTTKKQGPSYIDVIAVCDAVLVEGDAYDFVNVHIKHKLKAPNTGASWNAHRIGCMWRVLGKYQADYIFTQIDENEFPELLL